LTLVADSNSRRPHPINDSAATEERDAMKVCLFSVSYAGFWGQSTLSLDDFIRHAGRLGFPSVMIAGKRPHLSPLDTCPERVESLTQVLNDAHVTCDVIGAYTNLTQPTASGSEVPWLEFQISYVEALSRMASQLGASVVRIFTAYATDGQALQTQWNRCCVAIREMCDRAASYGVTFFQGLADGRFNGIATYEICSPVRGGGDLKNLDACGEAYLEWMRNNTKPQRDS
jgi:sugar phosphate isomerase/epimerase